MGRFSLTIRVGPRVERRRFGDLDAAIDGMRDAVREVSAEGGLPAAKAFREYQPGERVKARLELSAGGWLRSRNAGIDVMGDGSLVPYAGAVFKRPLAAADHDDELDAVREALA